MSRTTPLAMDLVRKSQRVLADHVEPGGPGARETIDQLLCILDGPQAEALDAAARAEGEDVPIPAQPVPDECAGDDAT